MGVMKLPPLNALRAFEAASRHGSYVAAAAELGVSPAAVSQQVRNLEQFFGKRLFERLHNRVALTEAGREIQAGASDAFRRLAELNDQVLAGRMPRRETRIVISAPPSLVERWLAVRLAEFVAREPEVRVEIRVEEDPVDFRARGLDLRICYGMRLYPELDVRPLFEDEVTPMASPAFLARHGLAPGDDLGGLDGGCFILTDWGPSFATHPTWRDWFGHVAPMALSVASGHVGGSSSVALAMAARGFGIALGQLGLADGELSSGSLVRLDERALPLGHPYCTVTRPGRRKGASLDRLLDLLATWRPPAILPLQGRTEAGS